MKPTTALLLSLFSGILLSLGWPVSGFPLVLFFAWVPLLWVEHKLSEHSTKPVPRFYMLALLCTFTWNLLSTWWIYQASLGGAAMAIVANTIIMAMVLYLFHWVKIKAGKRTGYIALIFFWMSFEGMHYEWDICWPWLNLGNGFAGFPEWIQWYEFTGIYGGTLWIWTVNLLLFFVFRGLPENRNPKTIVLPVLVVVLPILISLLMFVNTQDKGEEIKAIVIQPNIDPYTEKFDGLDADEQLRRILSLAEQGMDENTHLIVGPETAIVDNIWEHEFEEDEAIIALKRFMADKPNASLLLGASTLKLFEPGEALSESARKFHKADMYYDSYNTALCLNQQGEIQVYHKSKLVPGVEKMPWPFIFKHIEKFAIDLGGTTGSLGVQNEPTVFSFKNKKHLAAPIICYESVFGDYVSDYVRKGADVLVIITNDGWWGNTPGYKQHLELGTLRAIETRRSIIRSANTGISCFINQRGEIYQPSEWWKPQVIKGSVLARNDLTFYTKFGRAYFIMVCAGSLAVLLWMLILKLRK
jgi:apolipoprotein N-acyltransferase